MSMKKIYKCCICHNELDYKPIRLVKQINDNKETYSAYHNKANYDFCKECYKRFNNWLIKHKEVKEND